MVVHTALGRKDMDVTPEVDATNPNTLEVTPRADKRTAHCHQQAAECALAATTVVSSEIKAAYRNIEQAWLQLAPEIDSRRKG
jgi:hypothetical protein